MAFAVIIRNISNFPALLQLLGMGIGIGQIVFGGSSVYINKHHVVQINSTRLMRNFYLILWEDIEYRLFNDKG